MLPVRMTDGATRVRGHLLYRNARSWSVLPACVKPFTAELRATERCHLVTQKLLSMPRWRRLPRLPLLFQLRRLSLTRRTGPREARRKAWSLIWLALRSSRLPLPPDIATGIPPAPTGRGKA